MAKIEKLYQEVIKSPNKWNYLNSTDFDNKIEYIKKFKDLYSENSQESFEFINALLFHSGKKDADELYRCFDTIKRNDTERLRHIVSLFFFGHILYNKIPIIKEKINSQLPRIFRDDNKDPQYLFAYIWFVLCIFHDLGYAYEKKVLPKDYLSETTLTMPKDFLPASYTEDNIRKYKIYRKCKFQVDDHGIFGGQVFYDEMLEIGKKYSEILNKRNFQTNGVEHIYNYAAWIISCHNIFYNNGNDNYTNCYHCQGLDVFINPRARCLSIHNNPLMFLFCLADTIEPTKVLKSQKGEKQSLEICKLLRLSFFKNQNKMKLDLSDLCDYSVYNDYKKAILGLNKWLIDVSDDLVIKFK